MKQDRVDQAEKFLLKATDLETSWLLPYYLLADLYTRSGRLDQAIEKFEKALQVNSSLRLSFLLGHLYQEKGDIKAAKGQYTSILDNDPNFIPAANNLAYLIAEHDTDPAELRKGLQLAQKAAQKGHPITLDTLGWIYFKMGKKDMALKYLQQAREKDPDNSEIRKHWETVSSRI